MFADTHPVTENESKFSLCKHLKNLKSKEKLFDVQKEKKLKKTQNRGRISLALAALAPGNSLRDRISEKRNTYPLVN